MEDKTPVPIHSRRKGAAGSVPVEQPPAGPKRKREPRDPAKDKRLADFTWPAPHSGPGKPTKYVPGRVLNILALLERGNTRKVAANASGIGYSTMMEWADIYPEFAEAMEKAEAEAERAHVGNIAKAAKSGTWTASAWWLERRRREEWRRPGERDFSGEAPITFTVRLGTPVPVAHERDSMPAAEFAARLAALAAPADEAIDVEFTTIPNTPPSDDDEGDEWEEVDPTMEDEEI